MKLILTLFLFIGTAYGATGIPSGPIVTVVTSGGAAASSTERGETHPLANGLELRTGESFEEFEAAGRNPVFMRLQLDAPNGAFTTAKDASGTVDYTPPSTRVFHVRMVVNRAFSAAIHDWTMGTSTNVLVSAGGFLNPVYYMSSGSGFPRYFRCEALDTCAMPTYEFIVPNGRYIWANMTTGTSRSMEILGYEVDSL